MKPENWRDEISRLQEKLVWDEQTQRYIFEEKYNERNKSVAEYNYQHPKYKKWAGK